MVRVKSEIKLFMEQQHSSKYLIHMLSDYDAKRREKKLCHKVNFVTVTAKHKCRNDEILKCHELKEEQKK